MLVMKLLTSAKSVRIFYWSSTITLIRAWCLEQKDLMFWVGGIAMIGSNPIAMDILAIFVTTIALNSAFSTNGRLLSPHYNRLHHNTLPTLICAKLVLE